MIHIYLGLTLSLICLFLLYYILPKFLLVTVLCAILAGLLFKDDLVLFRYIATQVASFYSCICDFFIGIQNMYHQSNNSNFPVRKGIENNGSLSRKFDRLHHGSSYNLSTPIMDKPINSGIWNSSSKLSSSMNSFNSRAHSTMQEMSKLKIGHVIREENSTSDRELSKSYRPISPKSYRHISPIVSPLTIDHAGYSRSIDMSKSGTSPFHSSNTENKPPINAKLYADVSSPGFCGRVADRLHEENMTHQSKYDTVGAFPVINLKCQSPKIKIKTPVRVRLAPPSTELTHYNHGANTLTRSSVVGPDDSMKSVLQVLKEISRKRIHSHIDDDGEEGTKRLRVTDSPLDSDGLLHTSLLQQTIQGKRAREETSPNEDDKKRRKASLKNNEILSSLSSSISIKPPHLQSAKRKAQSFDDSITSTPVLGKLLKVQKEVTPPKPTNHISAPDTVAPPNNVQASAAKPSPSVVIPPPIVPTPVLEPVPAKPSVPETPKVDTAQPQDDGVVSRLLGRMSDQTTTSRPVDIPVKKNVFMSTNDLSLSPPKENRLAAMIAVLGGPSEQSELENIQSEAPKQPERLIKGKTLFMSPETPETPKQNKKVTFSDSLTTTKIFERDEPDNGKSTAASSNSLVPTSTPLPSITIAANTTPTGPKLNFGSDNSNMTKPFALNFNSSPSSSDKETSRSNENANFTMKAPAGAGSSGSSSPNRQTSNFQSPSSNLNFGAATSTTGVSGPTFSSPVVSNSSSLSAPSSGGFSFGANNSFTNAGKETSSKLGPDSTSAKPFSFGSDVKSTQASPSVSGFSSVFSTTSKGDTSTTGVGSTAAQSKPMFNIFGSKDSSTSKNESENKPMVNGFAAPSSNNSSPFALSKPAGQESSSKPHSFEANANATTTSQSASSFSFGSTAFSKSSTPQTTQQSTTSIFSSTTQQSNMPNSSFQPNSLINTTTSAMNMFSSSNGSPAQNKTAGFGSGIQSTSVPAFGDSTLKPVSSNNLTSQTNSVFGSTLPQSPGFGSSSALQNGMVSSTSGTSQNSNNIFGNISTNKPGTFGNNTNATTQPSTTPTFGFGGTTVSSPFGNTLNNTTSSTPTMFGSSTTTAQSSSMFGSGTTNTTAQSNPFTTPSTTAGQPSIFGSINNDSSKNMFSSATNSAPTFGGLGNTASPSFGNLSNPASTFGSQNNNSTPAFGSQNNNSTPAFGSQNNATTPAFGSQNTTSAPVFGSHNNVPASSFGSQSNTTASAFGSQSTTSSSTFGSQSNPAFTFGGNNSSTSQGGFSAPATFGGGSNSSVSNEVKPPAFGSSSPFMFGGSSGSKPAEAVKPLGTSSPFTFGSSAQPNSSTSSAQPAVPSFGAPNPTFGTSQPGATLGGVPQPAAPTFQFGQASSSAPAPAFQFNAAPPSVGGGMFSIGSGGSSTSRPKTTALRRSHKRT